MTIADKTQVQALLGNPSAGLVTDAELDNAIAFGDSEVIRRIGTVPGTSNPEYPSFQAASEQFALFVINNKFPAQAANAKNSFSAAVALCDNIIARDSDIDPESGLPMIEVGSYQTAPLNPDATYRFATKSRGGAMPSYADVVYGGWVF